MKSFISIRDQICTNPSCIDYKQRQNHIIIHSQKDKRVRCKSCGKTWVVHKNFLHYQIKSDPQKIYAVQKFIQQGVSISQNRFLYKSKSQHHSALEGKEPISKKVL